MHAFDAVALSSGGSADVRRTTVAIINGFSAAS
jgi:hypothetical protein